MTKRALCFPHTNIKKQLVVNAALAGAMAAVVFSACDDKNNPNSTDSTDPNGNGKDGVAVQSVTLHQTTATLKVGDTLTLAATVLPDSAANKNVTWTSSTPAVATVSNGTITAVSAGTATITVATQDGNKTAACAVTVNEPIKDQTFTANGVSFKMVYVAGGTFQMGDTVRDDEKPVHAVTVSSFSIGKMEVTQGLWKAVMENNPSSFKKGDNYPVESVSWNDIVGIGSATGYTINGVAYKTDGFCYKLSQLIGGGKQFCLPTEAQWEYAARGGQQTQGYTYSGSNTIDGVAWYSSNQTHAVGTKQANELGLYDMSGNVWEWCGDWYGSYSSSAQTDPTGASSSSYRVIRGGGGSTTAQYCRVASRYSNTRGYSRDDLGFRLALGQ